MRQLTRFFAICLLLANASQARAAIEDQSYPVERTKARVSKSSESNREDKTFLLAGEPIGFAVMPIPAMGLTTGYYLNPNLLVQAEFSYGRLDYFLYTAEAKAAEVNLKYFFGNSLYSKVGAMYREIGLKNILYFPTTGTDRATIDDAGSVQSLGAAIAIGNQWQWNNFTIGCDWFGVTVPLVNLKVDNRFADNNKIQDADRKELDKAWNDLGKAVSFQLARFYLGASF